MSDPPTGAAAAKPPPSRLAYLDTLRGLAVAFMIAWHTADSWANDDFRTESWSFELVRFLGGNAAPLFLFLVGVSLSLRAHTDATKGRSMSETARAFLWRGLEIVVLGYALRMQMWLIDAAGVTRGWSYRVFIPFGMGLALAFAALRRLSGGRRALGLVGAGVLLAISYAQLATLAPERMAGVSRVDVLQAIGVSMVVAGPIGLITGALTRRPWLSIIIAVVAALATATFAARLPGRIPVAIASYVARWEVPRGAKTPALFPVFPWIAHVFIGSAVATFWRRARDRGEDVRFALLVASIGALLSLLTMESLPHTYTAIRAWPDLVPSCRIAYRTGWNLIYAGACYGLAAALPRIVAPLTTLGQASLVIYWVHLEFAFGAAAKPLKHALGFSEWAWGTLGLALAMYVLAHVRVNGFRVKLA